MLYVVIKKIKIKKSLTLLKVNALNADFNVVVFVTQKLIRKKDVKPINSQPKNNIMVLPADNRNTMLTTKDNKNNKNRSVRGSYLKYEKAKKNTKRAIVVVNKIKLKDIVSNKK